MKKAVNKWQRQNEILTNFIRGQFTQVELGKCLGISHQAVSYKERNNSFTAEDLIRIMTKLDIDAELLKALLKAKG